MTIGPVTPQFGLDISSKLTRREFRDPAGDMFQLVPDPTVHSGFEAATVEARQAANDFVRGDGVVSGRDEQLGDAPDIFFRGHPKATIEASKVHGDGVSPQGSFAAQIVVVLKVAEGQFAQSAIDRGAKSKTRKVRFGDASPVAVLTVNGEHVIVVMHSFQVHQQGRIAVDAQGGGSE